MPACCQQTKIPFNNADTTTIVYDDVMRSKYGIQPRVFVWYYDSDNGEFYLSTFFTVMKYISGNIVVDHGGPNTGFVIVT